MFLRFDASLNGKSMNAIAPEIILRDILEEPIDVETQTFRKAGREGMRIAKRVRNSLRVRLVYNIRAYDIMTRTKIARMIAEWAYDGGWLTINTRPGQRLRVKVDNPPTVNSSLKWTQDLSVTFVAYERPYWEEQYPVRLTTTSQGVLKIPGTVPEAYVECTVTNKGIDDLTTAKIVCGETFMDFTGLSVPPGGELVISYTDDDQLMITAAGESALRARSAASSDDLILPTRQTNFVTVSADQAVSAVFAARGRYI